MRRWYKAVPVLATAILALSFIPALAQETQPTGATTGRSGGPARSGTSGIRWEGMGVRVGLSSSPDQIFGGAHFNLGYFAPNVRFRPSIDLGVGDHRDLLQALAEAHYVFSKVQVWKPYVGGGVGFTHVRFHDNDHGDDSDTSISIAGVGGVETRLRSGTTFLIEGKVGFGDDDPDFKVAAGWSWK